MLRTFGRLAAAAALSVPVALMSTFLLMPLWSWIEDTLGIESVGHSGPAEWCFAATYAAIAGALAAFLLWPRETSRRSRIAR
jgi:hypothetical protein